MKPAELSPLEEQVAAALARALLREIESERETDRRASVESVGSSDSK
jgi:hypothetical protein